MLNNKGDYTTSCIKHTGDNRQHHYKWIFDIYSTSYSTKNHIISVLTINKNSDQVYQIVRFLNIFNKIQMV